MSHGVYVWVAYGIVLLVMGAEVLVLLLKRKSLRHRKSLERETRS